MGKETNRDDLRDRVAARIKSACFIDEGTALGGADAVLDELGTFLAIAQADLRHYPRTKGLGNYRDLVDALLAWEPES